MLNPVDRSDEGRTKVRQVIVYPGEIGDYVVE
jgi:hypothetical protein